MIIGDHPQGVVLDVIYDELRYLLHHRDKAETIDRGDWRIPVARGGKLEQGGAHGILAEASRIRGKLSKGGDVVCHRGDATIVGRVTSVPTTAKGVLLAKRQRDPGQEPEISAASPKEK